MKEWNNIYMRSISCLKRNVPQTGYFAPLMDMYWKTSDKTERRRIKLLIMRVHSRFVNMVEKEVEKWKS